MADLDLNKLREKATDLPLHESGRHFVDGGYWNLTSCRHGDTGEFSKDVDGELIAALWNGFREGTIGVLSAPTSDAAKLEAAERVARRLRSLIDYCEWHIVEAGAHHPTLPSAVSAAKSDLAAYRSADARLIAPESELDWPDIPDTPEQRALIAEHNRRIRAQHPNMRQIDGFPSADAPSPDAGDGWNRDMNTAPRDGTKFCATDGRLCFTTFRGKSYSRYPDREGKGAEFRWHWSYEDRDSVSEWKPVAWMPLPAPPRAAKREAE